jgi:hypothetical protein
MKMLKQIGKPEGGRPRHRWGDNIKWILMFFEWESVEWTHLAQDRTQWWDLANTAMNLRILQRTGN